MNFFFLFESFKMALSQLSANMLRSFLSLAGISIGVFCIISVLASIYSLEKVIKSNFESLGEDILYIDKMPWKNEDPSDNYWKYMKRPTPSYRDYKELSALSLNAEFISYSVYLGRKIIKYRNNEFEDIVALGATFDYKSVFNLEFQNGRYFTSFEFGNANNLAIIGDNVAEDLFGKLDPINKEISLNGIKVRIVGVIKKSGDSMFNPIKFDNSIILPINFAKKLQTLIQIIHLEVR